MFRRSHIQFKLEYVVSTIKINLQTSSYQSIVLKLVISEEKNACNLKNATKISIKEYLKNHKQFRIPIDFNAR